MHWYDYIVWTALFGQALFVYQATRNYLYGLAKSHKKHEQAPRPTTAVVIPCKGLDRDFHANIESFFRMDYSDYRLFFVVAEPSDPAYKELCSIRDEFRSTRKDLPAVRMASLEAQILIAGVSTSCSQKIHNLLYGIEHLPDDTEILAFADSDARVESDWLTHLVWPLHRPKCGVATGYRWFVPTRNNPATLVLSAFNATVAQLLGNSRFNHAWGGSMAVRLDDFRRLGLRQAWKNTLSDDLSLTRAVKKEDMNVTFVPACLVASHEATTWSRLFEFARRQFLIMRVYAPVMWWLGLLSSLGSVVGLWGLLALAIHAWRAGAGNAGIYTAATVVFFAGQVLRAVLRQLTAVRLLPEQAGALRIASIADILGCWLFSPLLLSLILASGFGRTISWRGIRYRLISPTRTEILKS
jgi:ceramide glucosyltransferase